MTSFSIILLVVTSLTSAHAQCSHTAPCDFVGGDDFVPIQEYVSSNGSLNIELTVAINTINVEWFTMMRRTHNGGFPSSTWRIRRGDRVTVKLTNTLQLPQNEGPANTLHSPNSTNLHTHGLHISSQEPQDNVFVNVGPGENYTYSYEIDPENPSGTYWYHPHLHGSTLFQVHSGMAGMIIVEDHNTTATPQHILAVSCPDNCHHEVVLIFQPTMMYINNGGRGFANAQEQIQDYEGFRHNQYTITATGQTLEDWLTDQNSGVEAFTTNGQLWPRMNMTTGQTKRFRMANAGGSALLEVQLTNTNGDVAAGCTVLEIAIDGVYLDQAKTPRLGKTLLVPSSRADWLVVCDTPGTYELRSVPSNADTPSVGPFQRYTGKLLTMVVTGSATNTIIPASLPARPSFVADFRNLNQSQVTGRFVIEPSPGTRLNRERFESVTDFRFKAELGTVQEWYIVNSDSASHPIHIHVNHFQVISYNAYTGPYAINGRNGYVFFDQDETRCYHQHETYTGTEQVGPARNPLQFLGHETRAAAGGNGTLGYSDLGVFRDVMLIPPTSNITIRFLAHKYVGDVVIHCHLLNHEDTGMMMVTEIVPQGADTTANTRSGTAYPGQCKECDPYPFNHVDYCASTTAGPNVVTTTSSASVHDASFVSLLYALAIFVGAIEHM